MFEIIMFLRRLILLPYELVTFPFQAGNSAWQGSYRSRALLLGTPAVIIAIFGVGVLAFNRIGPKDRLISRYSSLQEETLREYVQLTNELNQERQLTGSIAEDDSRREEIDKLRKKEQLYLQKLIDLDSENPEYRYNFARSFQGFDNRKQENLMNELAPYDKTGYSKAHQYIAQLSITRAQRSQSRGQRIQLLELALKHCDHCLVQDENNRIVKQIKAMVLQESERYNEAYAIFRELFDLEPTYYQYLIPLHKLMELSPDEEMTANKSIANSALTQFKDRLKASKPGDTRTWASCWDHMVRCQIIQKAYDEAVKSLAAELKKETDAPRKKFLQERMCSVYTEWAGFTSDFVNGDELERREALDRLKKAYEFDSQNSAMLSKLSWFAHYDELLGPEAKEIYDPNLDDDAPYPVLSELGAKALRINDFDRAVEYFEKARQKNPSDPLVLNNLAYSYLVSEGKRNPERALYLVDDGIRRLIGKPAAKTYRTNLHHTRGTALMQLGRMEEAAASFEIALSDRPENVEIIESLIKCYEGRIDKHAQMYREYLTEIKSKQSNNG